MEADELKKIATQEALDRFVEGREVLLIYSDGSYDVAETLSIIKAHAKNGGEFGYEFEQGGGERACMTT